MSDEHWRLDATAQAPLVRAGDVSPAELVEHAIGRIERLDPRLNAVVTPLFERARGRAEHIDRAAPFAGVPLLVKDACLQIEGTPYYLGTSVLRDIDYRSPHTTELARRFERAGFVIVGKANVPELAATASTEPPAFGPTRNPWDLTRSPGGSSGGPAAVVATGMVPFAHGSDGGGSLRYPASACGVVTLKPSRGRVPTDTPSGEPDVFATWVEFGLARSVRDLAGVLDAVGGPGAGDAFLPPPDRPYADAIRIAPRPLRIGLLTRDVMLGLDVDAECVAAVEAAGRLLESLGHHVEVTHPPALDGLIGRIWASLSVNLRGGRVAALAWLERVAGRAIEPGELQEPVVREADVADVTAVQVLEAKKTIMRETAALRSWWSEGYDLLLTPVLRQPPFPLGGKGDAADAGVFPFPFSLSWQPAMSLPMHWTPGGLPVGVQLVGAYGREDVLLSIAAQLEAASPWADRWPPIAVET